MVTVSDLMPGDRFVFAGVKYAAFIKPKGVLKPDDKIVCYEFPQGEIVYFNSGEKVKPLIRCPSV